MITIAIRKIINIEFKDCLFNKFCNLIHKDINGLDSDEKNAIEDNWAYWLNSQNIDIDKYSKEIDILPIAKDIIQILESYYTKYVNQETLYEFINSIDEKCIKTKLGLQQDIDPEIIKIIKEYVFKQMDKYFIIEDSIIKY